MSSFFTLHLIEAGSVDTIQEKKVSSDLKTILKTDFANFRSLELCLRQSMSINLNYITWEKILTLT